MTGAPWSANVRALSAGRLITQASRLPLKFLDITPLREEIKHPAHHQMIPRLSTLPKQVHPGRKCSSHKGHAREERVVELGSAFLACDFGIAPEPREDHARSIESWLGILARQAGYLPSCGFRPDGPLISCGSASTRPRQPGHWSRSVTGNIGSACKDLQACQQSHCRHKHGT